CPPAPLIGCYTADRTPATSSSRCCSSLPHPIPASPEVHSHYPCEEGKPEESEPCTSTDDDSSLAGQEQVIAPGLATPLNNAGKDPTILDPDSDSSLPVPDDS
ncbi:unnamed protein product, partial [Coregonus sp. 'balchen']